MGPQLEQPTLEVVVAGVLLILELPRPLAAPASS
jgi:hypothetical protein